MKINITILCSFIAGYEKITVKLRIYETIIITISTIVLNLFLSFVINKLFPQLIVHNEILSSKINIPHCPKIPLPNVRWAFIKLIYLHVVSLCCRQGALRRRSRTIRGS